MTWILLLLGALAGGLRAVHDTLTHSPGALARFGPFWDARTSWVLKYRDYYNDPKTPRFWGSTTLFVAWTDAWHASNALCWACMDAALLVAAWQPYRWVVVGAIVLRRVIFEPLYSYLRKA